MNNLHIILFLFGIGNFQEYFNNAYIKAWKHFLRSVEYQYIYNLHIIYQFMIYWRQNASWLFYVNGCRSLRPLGCIGRDLPARHAHPAYYVSCIPFQPITLVPNWERRLIHVQRFLCRRRTRPEINALSEDSKPVLLSIRVGGVHNRKRLLVCGGKI